MLKEKSMAIGAPKLSAIVFTLLILTALSFSKLCAKLSAPVGSTPNNSTDELVANYLN